MNMLAISFLDGSIMDMEFIGGSELGTPTALHYNGRASNGCIYDTTPASLQTHPFHRSQPRCSLTYSRGSAAAWPRQPQLVISW